MAFIQKQDTDGTKGTLLKGEFGYDDYVTGGDTGRVYVGNGTANIALAKDSEVLRSNSPVITGLITEEVSVSTLTLGATSSVQTYTATGNFTIVDDLADGEFVTFIVTNAGFTPTWPTITWWGDAEPTLGTTDKIFFEKIGATLYGTHTGSIA